MDAKEILAWNVRKFRVERGLTQEALAFEIEIDRSYLGRTERAKENVTLNVLEKLATALGVPIGELFRIPEIGEVRPNALKAGRKRKH